MNLIICTFDPPCSPDYDDYAHCYSNTLLQYCTQMKSSRDAWENVSCEDVNSEMHINTIGIRIS